ncbi:cytochrome P450 CYP82D47-like isoform X1 [Rhododendron vialii]|uniref:cytochrome P450 CYP82D47-like isoform X1 n=1 Tax=Rhododendron vialii TaxID=182163 RepID=UPI00265F0CCF|nr:cytochrome P450 CYP82D47-like isoform X1 [Rhododendron vialii]
MAMEFLFPHTNTVVAGGVIPLLLLLYYFLRRSKTSKHIPPPEARGAWPIIGHLHLLGTTSDRLPHVTLGAMADEYGPIFTIRVGLKRAVVVSDWEIAKECFTTHDTIVSSRPKFIAAHHLCYNYAMLGFCPYGAYWREIRKIISLELLGSRRLELLKHVRVSETEASIEELHKLCTEAKTNSGTYSSHRGVMVEMKRWFSDLTMNVVVRMVVGKRYFGIATDGDEKEGRRCQKALRDFFYFLGLFLAADAIPFLRWLDLGGHEKAMKETLKEVDNLFSRWLDEHRQRRESEQSCKGDQDFMDVMLSTLEGTDLAGYDADTINKSTCLNIIGGGADTTSIMLTWALSLLLNNRHVLKKAQDELDLHVGKERRVDESDVNKLFYLQAIVKETLRLYPAGPLSGPRELTEDCTIRGYHIPKGTRLIPNLWKIQRDPMKWADPLVFRPERFLAAQKDVDVKGQHYELIPFGAGRRACPGIAFALQMLHLVLARLLHEFELSTPDDALVDMTESAGLTNAKATPLQVLITSRLAPTLQ